MLLNCFICVSVPYFLELSHFDIDEKSGQAKARVAKASGTAAHIIASFYSNKYKCRVSPPLIFLRMWASNINAATWSTEIC